MRRPIVLATLWLAWSVLPAYAQPTPPSSPPGDLAPGFVADRIVTGPAISLQNVTPTSNVLLPPFTPREFFQAPELTDPNGTATFEERLFKHDYLFTVPETVFGRASINDLELNIGDLLLEDILQLTFGLFQGSVAAANLVVPLAVAPDPDRAATLDFSGLTAGTQYILRVAGVLNGYALIPDGHEGAGLRGWHGQYQGNIAVLPIPGALALFLSALAGLGVVGWRRRSAAST
jgi:hypothetical protein